MQLGISSYTYTWAVGVPGSLPDKPLSAYGLIDKTITAGLRLVQVADNLSPEQFSETELDKLIKYAAERGVSIEMGGRGLTPEHTMRCLQTAEILGSPILRMVIDASGFEPDLQTIISIIRDLIPELKLRKSRPF